MMSRELSKVESLYDRQEILSNVAGFFAPTARELSESLTIVGTRDSVGVNQHFQEVYRRQRNNRVDKPENAIKSIVKEYIANYRSSEAIKKHLGYLALEISDICNPNIKLTEEVQSIRSGHRAFIRYVDLRLAYSDSDNVASQREALERSYFSLDDLSTDYVAERLSDISVKDSRKLVEYSIEDQANRSVFWRNTLQQSLNNRIAEPIIRLALRGL